MHITFERNKKMDETKIQSLFGWVSFYENTKYDKYPGILCFPDFFATVIGTIIQNYREIEINRKRYNYDEKTQHGENIFSLLEQFFESLQIMIDLILLVDLTIKLRSARDIIQKDFLREINGDMNFKYSHYTLEYYLIDEESKKRYRNALLEKSLEFYKVTTVEDLIMHLRKEGSCSDVTCKISLFPPDSIHYINQCKFSNVTDLPGHLRGPNQWGPVFWNIFHTLPQNAKILIRQNKEMKKTISFFLYSFIHILPLLLPCQICTHHYYACINPGERELQPSIDHYQKLYEEIHDTVNAKKFENHLYISF